MANDQTAVRKITFTIDEELTTCEIEFDTTNVVLTGRYRKKVFPSSKNCLEILRDEVPDYLMWD